MAFDELPTRWIMLLDDNSGAVIEVTCGRPQPSTKITHPEEDSIPYSGRTKPTVSSEGITNTGRHIDLHGIDIGTVIKVKGGIGSFRGEKQLHLERFCMLQQPFPMSDLSELHSEGARGIQTLALIRKTAIVHTTNEEAAAWAENTAFRRDILSIPWVVSAQDERRAKRKAEGFDQKKKARAERKRKTRRPDTQSKAIVTDRQRRKIQEERKQAAAEEEKARRDQAKRAAAAEERARREEARRIATEEEKARRQEVQRMAAEDDKRMIEAAAQTNAETKKREQEKGRREHERRLRELEYERLKSQRDKGLSRD